MPMLSRGARAEFKSDKYPEVEIAILDWYNSVIRLKSKDRARLEELATSILSEWRDYSDPNSEIIAYSDGAPHNTVTPIATLSGDAYSIYLILRNNRTDALRPHGIFHPTEDMHNIKKEGIGLIEAMGIFILPGRLYNETNSIVEILTGAVKLDFKELSREDNPLNKHLGTIAQLSNDYFGVALSKEKAETAVVNYINKTCVKILNCTAVFKNTKEGKKAFEAFLKSIDINQR